MKLKILCDAAGIACPKELWEQTVTGITSDSRCVRSGEMFVCVRGIRSDGHRFIEDAVHSGAKFVLVEHEESLPPIGGAILLRCDNTRRALAFLWDAWYGFPSKRLKLIGVTGTNGKTSVTHMIRAILEASLHPCGLIGTVGCEVSGKQLNVSAQDPLANMTTPDPKELYRVLDSMARAGAEYAVMEVSSHALSLEKVAPLAFAVAVFTNLTPEHLDFHVTMEAYAEAKAKLLEKAEISIINADSPYAALMADAAGGRVIRCTACDSDADYSATDIETNDTGVSYRLRSGDTRLRMSCPLPGHFTVTNSMQAAVCALELGCSPATVQTVLSTLSPIKGRMERVRLGLDAEFSVLIDYAHTPDAMEKILRVARTLVGRGGKLTVLFGCGGDRDRSKRAVMGRISSALADEVILTSDNSRSEEPTDIIKEIHSGMTEREPIAIIVDRAAAIRFAVTRAHRGDVILLCGKGHEEYEIGKEGRRPFCEREIATDAFRGRKRKTEEPRDEDSI